MADDDANDNLDIRREVIGMLLTKVAEDTYPSTTMMNLIEELLTDDERELYVQVLWEKIRADTYPSLAMMTRLRDQAVAASPRG